MRQKIVAGNWKMNNTLQEGEKLTSEVVNMVADEVTGEVTVVLCPPFIHLPSTLKLTEGASSIYVGAQNCSEHDAGAYTGEVSSAMLASLGVQYVIIGHSERREYFGDDDLTLATKVKKTLDQNLIPIFCCGESLDIREDEEHFEHVTDQVTKALFQLSAEELGKVVIAYEPIWAIGTGKTASAEQAQEMHKAIRSHIAKKFGDAVADELSILYGGSVKPGNAKEIFAQPDVDGGLIGGASLKSRDFVDIVKAI